MNMLTENRDKLDKIASVLMEREKLDQEEFRTLMDGGEIVEETAEAEEAKAVNPIEELLEETK